jgi:hypothetical protein
LTHCNDLEAMLCTPLRIIFNIRTNPKYSDLKSCDLGISDAEEKYLKIIDETLFDGSNITPRIASEVVFFVKRMVLFAFHR